MQLDVSIHDVMPETLDQVERIHQVCTQYGHSRVTLLVVPGAGWEANSLRRLRDFVDAHDLPLAGHGWCHQRDSSRPTSLYTRLHAWLISGDVAEHLALDHAEIAALIQRCYDWFDDVGLPSPLLYVPPAWAMGHISPGVLQTLPFRYYEYLRGLYDSDTDTFINQPLTGYEAGSAVNALMLRVWNGLNLQRAKHQNLLRISIHPQDLELALAGDLQEHLARFVSSHASLEHAA
ncbi:MAG TPA: DUF2334 domain-containing protein [Gammaproteobacteria bacterium]|jgi:predicted deacetylase|nr:DUF2334 domain-containing protein [Gammaproteobacteria bacterium]